MNAQAPFDSDSRPLKSPHSTTKEGGMSDQRKSLELRAGFQAKALPAASSARCSGDVCTLGEWKPNRQS